MAPPDPKQIFGLQIQIKTTAKSDAHAKALLRRMGIPFRQSNKDEPIDLNSLSLPDSH